MTAQQSDSGIKTICLVVGASLYADPSFHPLPGAEDDAKRFTAFLLASGVPQEWVYVLQNPTKAELIKAFYDVRGHFDVEAKFIFYFAGHGLREQDGHQIESSLVMQDTYSDTITDTGLRLVELMQLIRGLKPQQTFLFIDACRLRLNALSNPLNDSDIFSTTNSKGFFCLFSSGISPSYEDVKLRGGYFTNALLRAFQELKHAKNPTCHDILQKVEKSLLIEGLPSPEAYHIGSSQIWPLENHYAPSGRCTIQNNEGFQGESFVERWEALSTLKELLSKSTAPLVWMWGESGLGKTVIAEQLRRHVPDSIYTSLPHASSQVVVFQSLIEQIRLQKSELFFNRPPESLLFHTLSHIKSQSPNCLIIIDHLDRLLPKCLEELIVQLDKVLLPCVVISRTSCPSHLFNAHLFKLRNSGIIQWQATPFNSDEIEELIAKSGLQNQLSDVIAKMSYGNALKTRQVLVQFSGDKTPLDSAMNPESIKAITAICSCGGFLDEGLFCESYGISRSLLRQLEQFGLIRYTKEGCFPHDALEDLVEKNNWPIDLKKACDYWQAQIQKTPYNRVACRSLVILCGCIKNLRPYKQALGQSLETLNERQYRNFLLDLAAIFTQCNWKELLLKASDYLVDHEEYKLAGELLQELMSVRSIATRHHAIKNAIRRLVWIGRYIDALALYETISQKCRDEKLLVAMRNHVGIAYFFLGKFDEAVTLFKKNLQLSHIDDEREVGIAKYMLGLILTYRQENLAEAKKLLEASVRIFESSQFFHWSIVSLNGLAVMHNSVKERRQALIYLQKAHEISEALQNKTFLLQTLKNTARVQLREFGAKSVEIAATVELLEEILKEVLAVGHNWATMWAQNILCTVYAHQNKPVKIHAHLQDVIERTKNFDECHIFTLSNMGHFAALNKEYRQARMYYEEAYALCRKARIPLAQMEIREDFLGCALPKELQEWF